MDHTYTKQCIRDTLNTNAQTHETYAVALFSVLDHTFATASQTERTVFRALCRERLTPALVRAVCDTKDILARLTDELASIRLPRLNDHDVESTMHILHGRHRQAVRFLFAALDSGTTDSVIEHDLRPLSDRLRPDLEIDPRGFRMHALQREAAMLRLLRFRDDVPADTLFIVLWNVCLAVQKKPLLSDIAFQIINPLLIEQLAQRPASLRVVDLLEKALRVSTHTPPPGDSRQQDQRQQEQRQREHQQQQKQRQREQQRKQDTKPHSSAPSLANLRRDYFDGTGRERAKSILNNMDTNKDGVISQSEAVKACRQKSEDAKAIGLPLVNVRQEDGTRDAFAEVFASIDLNNDKTLDEDEVREQLWTIYREQHYKP